MRGTLTFSPGLALSALVHLALIVVLLTARAAGTGPPVDPGPVAVRLASPSDLYAAEAAAAGPPAPKAEALEVEATAPEPAPTVEAAPQPAPKPQIRRHAPLNSGFSGRAILPIRRRRNSSSSFYLKSCSTSCGAWLAWASMA